MKSVSKLYYLLPSIIVYACFAFVLLELNPCKWDAISRVFFVFVMIGINAFGLYVIQEIKNGRNIVCQDTRI